MTSVTGGKAHLAWCVQRAMQYANNGEWSQAWASFASDVTKHRTTAWIVDNPMLGMAMLSGAMNTPSEFEKFISGWSVPE